MRSCRDLGLVQEWSRTKKRKEKETWPESSVGLLKPRRCKNSVTHRRCAPKTQEDDEEREHPPVSRLPRVPHVSPALRVFARGWRAPEFCNFSPCTSCCYSSQPRPQVPNEPKIDKSPGAAKLAGECSGCRAHPGLMKTAQLSLLLSPSPSPRSLRRMTMETRDGTSSQWPQIRLLHFLKYIFIPWCKCHHDMNF